MTARLAVLTSSRAGLALHPWFRVGGVGLPRFAVVDVETSGLSSRRHRILQIGVVTVEGDGTVVDQWSSLVRLTWPWSRVGPRRSTASPGGRCAAPRRPPRRWASSAGGSTAPCSRPTTPTSTPLSSSGRPPARESACRSTSRLCTLQLSRRLDPDRLLTHGLADVCARYDVTIERQHDALYDARATAAVLPHLLVAHGVADEADLDGLYSGAPPPGASGPVPP